MPAVNTQLRSFIEDLILTMDSTVDTSVGSQWDINVIQPMLDRVGSNPVEVSVEQLIKDRIKTIDPQLSTDGGSALGATSVNIATHIFAPLRNELVALRKSMSLRNADIMSEDEMDALVANFFIERISGDKSTGNIRIYYINPVALSVSPLNRVLAINDLAFFPSTTTNISAEDMSFNVDGSRFYVDVAVIAENEGDEYNIDINQVTTIEGLLPGPIKVTNREQFKDGRTPQTNEDLAAVAANSLTVRDINTLKGINFVLPDNFLAVNDIEVVAYGNSEMRRDRITGVLEDFVILERIAVTIVTADPAGSITGTISSGGGLTTTVISPDHGLENENEVNITLTTSYNGVSVLSNVTPHTYDIPISFVADETGSWTREPLKKFRLPIGPADPSLPLDVYINDVIDPTWTFGTGPDYNFIENVSAPIVSDVIKATYRYNFSTDLEQLSISDIPGGFLGPAPLLTDPNEVAVGGKTDIYIKETDLSVGSYDLVTISPTNPVQVIAVQDPESLLNLVSKPLVRMVSVERIDQLSLQPTGEIIPKKDPVDIRTATFVGGGGPNGIGPGTDHATGTVRFYFLDPTSFSTNLDLDGGTEFETDDGIKVFPIRIGVDADFGNPTSGYAQATAEGTVDPSGNATIFELPSGNTSWDNVEVGSILTDVIAGVPQSPQYIITDIVPSTDISGIAKITIVRQDLTPIVATDYGYRPTAAPVTDTIIDWVISPGTSKAFMEARGKDNGLYYFDMLCYADPIDNTGNFSEDTELVVVDGNYFSEGWYLETANDKFSFSVYEELTIGFTSTFDDYTLFISNNSVRLNYEYGSGLNEIQDFVTSDINRVVVEDVMIRHFLPAFVRLKINYKTETIVDELAVVNGMEEYIEGVGSLDPLEAFEVQKVLQGNGASFVELPFELVVIEIDEQRSYKTIRSISQIILSSRTKRFLLDTDQVELTDIS
ncbi:hypothetical protein LCGC14_0147510 [marine sediment metagenome]|uniref:Uncharacterized protein n=1 Tax=marine sediment metagenome TaxID=412755 RepID=A0A0F9V3R5_9ZZZZ